ncbi:hypothetical protein A1O1_09036 [Capronia coronata CBS 617.96]|uniref:DUF614 domain-containing protein n=1 Tax=Capronia coronata CBS 617.96 TaxID=1182541 RepID=W9XMS8_9EURO|nr:uncharacterized protein A1O1_09036 [Capronia coronata CBS 617.96]EXJ78635.1 hypothetical protein A1O1_09036 [Capronia coronata CBS 617.96]
MKPYEYPRVRPPTSLQAPQIPTGPRFSWMVDTPAEEENRVWTNNTARGAIHISIPTAMQGPGQEGQEGEAMEPRGYNYAAYAYQGRDVGGVVQQQQQQHIHDYEHQHQHQQDLYPTSPAPTPQGPIPLPAQTQSATHGPPLSRHERQAPIAADPVKQPQPQSQHPPHEPTTPIQPDVNPLTPTTPKVSDPASTTTTNMAIILPSSDPSHFSVGTFTPSPQAIRGGSWQHGLCSCAEPSTCMTALFCPCLVYGKTQYRLGLRADRKDPTNMLGYTAVNGSCIAFGVLCGVNGILAAIQHTRVRKAYHMNTEAGNIAGDCLNGCCCCCCVVAQDEKEVKFREEQARKPAGSTAGRREGYVAPTAMTFGAPPR